MYFPYFFGKQFELLAIRACIGDGLIDPARAIPIVQPVAESLAGIGRLKQVADKAGSRLYIRVNPRAGRWQDHKRLAAALSGASFFQEGSGIRPAIGFSSSQPLAAVCDLMKVYSEGPVAVVHEGSVSDEDLLALIKKFGDRIDHHLARTDAISDSYKGRLLSHEPVMLHDGFKRQRTNLLYPSHSHFGNYHVTYEPLGFGGYGDYLTNGDFFQEGGANPYAVVLHLTVRSGTGELEIRHFASKQASDVQTGTEDKFREALGYLVDYVDRNPRCVASSSALEELRSLHEAGHYPGLGKPKELAFRHHVAQVMTDKA